MRDQYAGDVSDVLKFSFLRALAGTDRTLGIAWYYVPGDDGKKDGRHLEWREEPAWQRLDPQLHAGLSTLPERSVAALERAAIWPKGTLFHREPVPANLYRSLWGKQMRAKLDSTRIVFLDPDNGLGKESIKYATLSEVRLFRRSGCTVVFITFPGRQEPHEAMVKRLYDRLKIEADAKSAVTLRTNISVMYAPESRRVVQRQRWFTLVDPDDVLVSRAWAFTNALESVPRVWARLEPME